MMHMNDSEMYGCASLETDTEVYFGMICKVPLREIEFFRRLVSMHGGRIVYQLLAAEPLRIVAKREYDGLLRGDDDDCRTVP